MCSNYDKLFEECLPKYAQFFCSFKNICRHYLIIKTPYAMCTKISNVVNCLFYIAKHDSTLIFFHTLLYNNF